MIDVFVKSRKDIEDGYAPLDKAIMVSITDADKPNVLRRDRGYRSAYHISFADKDIGDGVITRRQAKGIWAYVLWYVNGGITTVVVHCEAGMSRSAGVAAAISKILNGDDSRIINMKPLYNRKVYRMMLEEFHDTFIDGSEIKQYTEIIKKIPNYSNFS